MKVQSFTFDKYEANAHGRSDAMSNDRNIGELPIELTDKEVKKALIVQAGFDPAVVGDHIGMFQRKWNNHPVGSIIIATSWNFSPGTSYAISREPFVRL